MSEEIYKYFKYMGEKKTRKYLNRLCREKKIQRVIFSGYISKCTAGVLKKEVYFVP